MSKCFKIRRLFNGTKSSILKQRKDQYLGSYCCSHERSLMIIKTPTVSERFISYFEKLFVSFLKCLIYRWNWNYRGIIIFTCIVLFYDRKRIYDSVNLFWGRLRTFRIVYLFCDKLKTHTFHICFVIDWGPISLFTCFVTGWGPISFLSVLRHIGDL